MGPLHYDDENKDDEIAITTIIMMMIFFLFVTKNPWSSCHIGLVVVVVDLIIFGIVSDENIVVAHIVVVLLAE